MQIINQSKGVIHMTSNEEHENNREFEHDEHEPTVAPGMDTHNTLEDDASEEEIKEGESTEVTRLYLDRTPED
jgi:hypothetical protein